MAVEPLVSGHLKYQERQLVMYIGLKYGCSTAFHTQKAPKNKTTTTTKLLRKTQNQMKALLCSFHLVGHTKRFNPWIQELEPCKMSGDLSAVQGSNKPGQRDSVGYYFGQTYILAM